MTEYLEAVVVEHIEFELGDSVVYPHHGAGRVLKKESKVLLGQERIGLGAPLAPPEELDRASVAAARGENDRAVVADLGVGVVHELVVGQFEEDIDQRIAQADDVKLARHESSLYGEQCYCQYRDAGRVP